MMYQTLHLHGHFLLKRSDIDWFSQRGELCLHDGVTKMTFFFYYFKQTIKPHGLYSTQTIKMTLRNNYTVQDLLTLAEDHRIYSTCDHFLLCLGPLDAMLRGLVISRLGKSGDEKIINEARQRFYAHCKKAATIPADLRSAVSLARPKKYTSFNGFLLYFQITTNASSNWCYRTWKIVFAF